MQVRRLGAGFLAGASTIAGLLAILVFLLFAAGVLGLIRDIAMEVHGDVTLGQAIGGAFVQSFQALPGYFWSARWAMVALGVLGCVLALLDVQRVRLTRRWHDALGYVVTNGVVAAVVIGALYANQDGLYRMVAEQPGLFTQQAVLFASDRTLLFIGCLIGLGVGYVVWASWQWWYGIWARSLGVERPAVGVVVAPTAPTTNPDDWRAYQERVMRLKRQSTTGTAREETEPENPPAPVAPRSWIPVSLGVVLIATVVLFGLLQVYRGLGPGVTSGEFWLDEATPAVATGLSFQTPPRSLTVSNTAGSGEIGFQVSGGGTTYHTETMPLAEGVGYQSKNVDLSNMAVGDYRLDMQLRSGQGGQVRYVVLFGGGGPAQGVGALIGLLAGIWVAAANVALLEWFASRGMYGR